MLSNTFVYFSEISRIYNAHYKPDETILAEDDRYRPNNNNNNSGSAPNTQQLGFEALQSDLPRVPPTISPVSNVKSTRKNANEFSCTNGKMSFKTSINTEFDESLLPSVPNFNEDSENVPPTENPPNGNEDADDVDYFQNVLRRFENLKKKHT